MVCIFLACTSLIRTVPCDLSLALSPYTPLSDPSNVSLRRHVLPIFVHKACSVLRTHISSSLRWWHDMIKMLFLPLSLLLILDVIQSCEIEVLTMVSMKNAIWLCNVTSQKINLSVFVSVIVPKMSFCPIFFTFYGWVSFFLSKSLFIWTSYGSFYDELLWANIYRSKFVFFYFIFVEYKVTESSKSETAFQRNILLPSSEWKRKLSKKPA
jgi:hypothetical protein